MLKTFIKKGSDFIDVFEVFDAIIDYQQLTHELNFENINNIKKLNNLNNLKNITNLTPFF